MDGKKPDYIVRFPVEKVWHKLGVAWKGNGDTINVILDVGIPMVLQPGARLVLVPANREANHGEEQ
jgi:hypothetical protein